MSKWAEHANPISTIHSIKEFINKVFFDLMPTSRASQYPGDEAKFADDIKRHGPIDPIPDQPGNQQGWFPLFVEWEICYYHIPWLQPNGAEPDKPAQRVWSPVLDDKTGLWKFQVATDLQSIVKNPDVRSIKNRMPITPQSSLALKSAVATIMDTLQDGIIDKDLRSQLLDDIERLPYLSCQLAGFTDHLTTLLDSAHGAGHMVDLVHRYVQDDNIQLSAEAIAALEISGEVDKVPYGYAYSLPKPYLYSPFKPVTHGQARFTKLTIVDKFGQLVVCVKGPNDEGKSGALYPCISQHFACGSTVVDGSPPKPNTIVVSELDPAGMCQFFQLPPRINQPARLNATFMSDDGSQPLTSAVETARAVQGWLVMNYPDRSLQTFDTEGRFYCELAFDDINPTVARRSFEGGLIPDASPSATLKEWVTVLSNLPTIRAVWEILEAYTATGATSARHHTDILPAAVGKVFALVNVGFSLELSAPPLRNRCMENRTNPEIALVDYSFPLQIGNAAASEDGCIAYAAKRPETIIGGQHTSDIFSYYAGAMAKPTEGVAGVAAVRPINDFMVLPSVKPYFTIDQAEHHQQLQHNTFSAIVDPFLAVQGHTAGLVPAAALKLPEKPTKDLAKRLWAFFDAGPLLQPQRPPSLGLGLADGKVSSATWLQPSVQQGEMQPIWTSSPALGHALSARVASDVREIVQGVMVMNAENDIAGP